MDRPGDLPRQVAELACRAGEAIMEYFQAGNYSVEHKRDSSPVTTADIAAHDIIVSALPELLDVPVISEEGAAQTGAVRRSWPRCWLIDPLDGTREFIAGRGEFTVNIALIDNGRPVLGIVYCPPHERLYVGSLDATMGPCGAYLQRAQETIWRRLGGTHFQSGEPLHMVQGRRTKCSDELQLLTQLQAFSGGLVMHQLGSSLKLCALAEGRYHMYPRLGPTCEWDTAAGHAVLEAAGGEVLNATDLQPLTYNLRASLLNPPFWALTDWSPKAQQFWQQVHQALPPVTGY